MQSMRRTLINGMDRNSCDSNPDMTSVLRSVVMIAPKFVLPVLDAVWDDAKRVCGCLAHVETARRGRLRLCIVKDRWDAVDNAQRARSLADALIMHAYEGCRIELGQDGHTTFTVAGQMFTGQAADTLLVEIVDKSMKCLGYVRVDSD